MRGCKASVRVLSGIALFSLTACATCPEELGLNGQRGVFFNPFDVEERAASTRDGHPVRLTRRERRELRQQAELLQNKVDQEAWLNQWQGQGSVAPVAPLSPSAPPIADSNEDPD